MQKIIWSFLLAATVVLASSKIWPQDTAPSSTPEKHDITYNLEFSLNELEDGKKINTRHYSIKLTSGSNRVLKIGTRVPVETEQGKFQYLDVGTNLRAHMYGKDDAPILDVDVDISNFAIPDQATHSGGQPLLRQILISGSQTLIFDKPTVVGSVDDPNSKRTYQLEVVATKLSR